MERGIKSLEEYQERVRGWERRVASYASFLMRRDFIFLIIFVDSKMAEFFTPQMNEELCPIKLTRIHLPTTRGSSMNFGYYAGGGLRLYSDHRDSQLQDIRERNSSKIERWFETNAPGVSPWVREVI